MMRAVRPGWTSFLPSLLLLACSETDQVQPPKARPASLPGVPAAAPAASAPADKRTLPGGKDAGASKEAQGAAGTLKSYYALIAAGHYAEAYALRERGPSAPDAGAFARNFERYREHHANVGTPSEMVAAGGSFYVEVPVHTYGVMKSGRSFSSAGTVTLRRKQSGSSGGRWRIYTSG